MTIQLNELRPATAIALPCHLVDPDVFFAEQPVDIEYAKALCLDCPIKAECLEGALARHEACGVWGGELLVNGVIVARKRPRGRPRKHPLPVEPPAPVQAGHASAGRVGGEAPSTRTQPGAAGRPGAVVRAA